MTREEARKIALDNIKQGIEKDGENAIFCAMPRPGKNSWTLKEALEAIENDKCLEGTEDNIIDMVLDLERYKEERGWK